MKLHFQKKNTMNEVVSKYITAFTFTNLVKHVQRN